MAQATKQTSIRLGAIDHFSLAVRDPEKTSAFWTTNFDLKEILWFDGGVGLSNGRVTIVLQAGEPCPVALGHLAFRLESMDALRAAVTVLKANGVEVEDPDDAIGREDHVAPQMSCWFHCLDGYRWELSVPSEAKV